MGLLVSLSLFTVTFGVVVYEASRDASSVVPGAEEGELAVRAGTLADLLLGQPGSGWYGATPPCDDQGGFVGAGKFDADGVAGGGRFGLAEDPCVASKYAKGAFNTLNHSKWTSLSQPGLVTVPDNDRVEYEEARASLGLQGSGVSFRLEGFPTLFLTRQALERGWSQAVKPLYIGNWLPPCTPPPPGPPTTPMPGVQREVPKVPDVNPPGRLQVCPPDLVDYEAQRDAQVDGVKVCLQDDELGVPRTCPGEGAKAEVAVSFSSGAVAWESKFLTALGLSQFDASVRERAYSRDALVAALGAGKVSEEAPAYSTSGDVLPDSETSLKRWLPQLLQRDGKPSLTEYTVLIVGSGVSDRALKNSKAAEVILPWVQAGGRLFVLGSSSDTAWLQGPAAKDYPNAVLGAHTGQPSAPEPGAIVLRRPHALDWSGYLDRGRAWTFHAQGEEAFEFVVSDGGQAYLALSKEGRFGRGQIILTSWQPDRLTTEASGNGCPPDSDNLSHTNCEPVRFLQNLFLLPFSNLYLDFGPPAPKDRAVEAQSRVVTVVHPALGEAVELSVVVKAWRAEPDRASASFSPSPPPPPPSTTGPSGGLPVPVH